ncbi:extracellular solute-binding protein [Aquisalimonas lutea]|uniref:ABC transporter substrate-binding protein n=1 Tax=Aquisalimonas lutea TaxID=1327750 RepID=UPI0025B36BC1|nr:extracellular solute-binding protein [Aquisalimonas lutea]MDN3517607.1 extracellular solute-binding protein [Aquisalimonas lutea]
MSKHTLQQISHIHRKGFVTAITATALLAVSGAAQAAGDPPDIEFRTQYGDMSFPESFPDGTELRITQWSHFVPRYDEWFEEYAQDWGDAHNVDVTVNFINLADLSSTLSASISAGEGATLFEMVAPPTAFIDGLQSLDDVNEAAQAEFGEQAGTCARSSYLPAKDQWYGFCHGWVPDPGDYRRSLWDDAGYPEGPETYQDLLEGGAQIYEDTGIPVGVGMSPEIDSEFYARALIWSHGGSIQDENGNVTFDSEEVLEAVKFQQQLYNNAMTPEVFAWNAASNNQTFIGGRASYIQNSISFYRSAQESAPEIAADTGFRPGLEGPRGDRMMPSHVWFIYTMPDYVEDEDTIQAAKKFMLDLEGNYANASYYSKFYNFPAFPSTAPQLLGEDSWLDNDPWGAEPADKLSLLKTAEDWTAWLGYPGYANPAISEVYQSELLSSMMADVARGVKTPEEAVSDTAEEIEQIFAKWRERGYVGEGN